MRKRLLLGATAILLACTPAAASAATLTLASPCVRDGSPALGITLAGFPPNAMLRLLNDSDLIDSVQVDDSGGFTGQFAPFSNGDLTTKTSTLTATDDNGTSATATLTDVDLLVGMAPYKARWSTKVSFRAQGFIEAIGTPLYAHYTYVKSDVRHILVKTVKLGTLGPCGVLNTPKVKQLPVKNPRAGSYVVQFDASPAFKYQQGVYVERSVYVPKK